MKLLNCVLYYEDSFTPIQFEEEMTILNAKMLICESLGLDYNSISLLIQNCGQLDSDDLLELPLSVFGLDESCTHNIFVYDSNNKQYYYKHCCSKQIIGNIPIEQIGFKLPKEYKLPICLVCSQFCHKGDFDPQKDFIVKSEFICRCALSKSSKCHFDFHMSFNTDKTNKGDKELVFITIKSLLQFHSEGVKTYTQSKQDEIDAKIANRVFNFDRSIKNGLDRVKDYDDKETINAILSIIPKREVNMTQLDYVKLLLHWFKTSFFTWCDKPKCFQCNSNTKCNYIKTDNPNEEETHFLASRSEVFECSQCKTSVRFPRYNRVIKLLQTKTGRCGEWANAFGCILNAVGFDVRFIDNFEDHVWNEFYSVEERRWIHVDPCEEAFDKPLLYEQGWGRVMSIIMAYNKYYITDVTKRYIKNWKRVSKRHAIAVGNTLEETILGINMSLEENIPQSDKKRIEEMIESERKEFDDYNENRIREISDSELVDRQSGSVQWRKDRGELK